LNAHLAMAATALAGHGLRPDFGARAATGLATLECRDTDFGFRAACSVFERDLQVVAQIGAAVDVGACAAPATEDLAENIAERIGEAATEPARAGGRGMIYPGGPEAIVCRAPVGITQDLVSFLGFLETLFRLGIVRIAIRMVLHGEFAVCLLEVVFRAIPLQPEDLVVVALSHAQSSVIINPGKDTCPTFPIDRRRTAE